MALKSKTLSQRGREEKFDSGIITLGHRGRVRLHHCILKEDVTPQVSSRAE